MSFKAVKIPQNVYVEDRIIGPVSLRQIFMLLAGGGVSYVIWTIMDKNGFVSVASGTIASIPTVIMALFAFVKISQISLSRFCLLMIEQSKKPTVRYWQPRVGIELRPYKASVKPKPEQEAESISEKKASQIAELSSVLDTNIMPQPAASPPSQL